MYRKLGKVREAMKCDTYRDATSELLATYTELLNRFGIDSHEASAFVDAHRTDAEFVELAETARTLKAALCG